MKNVSMICLLCLCFGAHSSANAQSISKCFRADWLQGARTVSLKIQGSQVTGTFTVAGDGGDSNRPDATYKFSGTLKGNALTVAFAGNKLPDVAPSEMKSLVWTLVKSGDQEALRIKFTGKNYETNKYEDRFADFASCPAASAQATDEIASIRGQYATINAKLAKYKTVKKELVGFSTEGGEMVAYLDGTAIVKIAATYQGETGAASEDFYYSNGKLIFAFRKQDTYDSPLSGKVVRTRESRFYFNNDKLIRMINESGKQVAPRANEYAEAQTFYLGISKLFTEGARSPQPMIEAPDTRR